MSWEEISDRSNPFNKTGLSQEVTSMLDYLEDAKAATGVDVVCTSTTDHPKFAASGNLSRHLMEGTEGIGLGLDCRKRQRGLKTHREVFELFVPVEHLMQELIYADPPIGLRADGTTGPYNIRGGRRVAPFAVKDHMDHVHGSVIVGRFLTWPRPPALPDLTEDTMPTTVQRAQGGAIVVAPDGGVFAIEGAPFHGSLPGINVVPNEPIVGASWTPSGDGYWLLGADGGLFAFGDAPALDGANVDPLKTHLGPRKAVGLITNGPRSVDIVAFDPSNDGSPYDTYRAS